MPGRPTQDQTLSSKANEGRTCSVEGCVKNTVKYRKMCSMHKARLARKGSVGSAEMIHQHIISGVDVDTLTGDCRSCGRVLVYWRDAGKWSGYACKPSHDRRVRNSALKRRFGITLLQYEEMLEKQNFSCAICKQKFNENLAVDHDHSCCPGREKTCGKCIRGLLCMKCNMSLGGFEDAIERLENAIDYLKTYDR